MIEFDEGWEEMNKDDIQEFTVNFEPQKIPKTVVSALEKDSFPMSITIDDTGQHVKGMFVQQKLWDDIKNLLNRLSGMYDDQVTVSEVDS